MFLRAILCCLIAASIMIFAAGGTGHPAWQYASGLVIAAAFVPYLLRGPMSTRRRLTAVWCALMTVTVICLWSEGVIFIHQTRQQQITSLIGASVLYSLLAIAIAVVSSLLRLHDSAGQPHLMPPAPRFVLRVLGSGVAYAIYYYVFGAVAFFLFTKTYYSGSGPLAGAQETARGLGLWFPLIQIGRGALMTLGVAPIILSLRMKRWNAAIYVGLLLWIIGGVAPLMVPNPILPGELRLMHTVEIFTQNVPFGITAVLLLRRKKAPPTEQLQMEPAGS